MSEDDTQGAPDDLVELVAMSEHAEKLAADNEPDRLRDRTAELRDGFRKSARQRSRSRSYSGKEFISPWNDAGFIDGPTLVGIAEPDELKKRSACETERDRARPSETGPFRPQRSAHWRSEQPSTAARDRVGRHHGHHDPHGRLVTAPAVASAPWRGNVYETHQRALSRTFTHGLLQSSASPSVPPRGLSLRTSLACLRSCSRVQQLVTLPA